MMRRGFLSIVTLILLALGMGGTAAAQENTGLSAADIARISQSVVYIENFSGGEAQSTGSGTIVDPSGLIYTNHHVIEGGEDFLIYSTSEVGELPIVIGFASIVQDFNDIDFSILQIDRDAQGNPISPGSLNLPALQDASREAVLGERIWVFGYPDIGDGYLIVTQGSITSVENANLFERRVPAWYRTDAEISPGNSGGLVVNGLGQFLGIPTMVRSEERTLGRLGGVLPFIAVETVLAAYESGAATTTADTSLTIQNTDKTSICFVYISLITSTNWGSDQLGNRSLATGQSVTFDIEPGDYDISMRDCANEELASVRSQTINAPITLTYPVGDTAPAIVTQSLSASITSIEYDVATETGGESGIKVHTEIRALGYRDQEVRVAVFYYNADDSPISCANMSKEYCDPDNGISVQTVLVPSFDDTVWEDYWFWIPYSGFPEGLTGVVNFTAQANVGLNGTGALKNPSEAEPFSIDFGSGGNNTTTSTANFTVSVASQEFDATGDHSTDSGIRTYLNFTAESAKDTPVRVALFFYFEDGTTIKCDPDYDDYYCDGDGDLTIQEVVTPSYDSSEWTDYWIHIPYNAFPKGLSGTIPVTVKAFIDLDGGPGFNFSSDNFGFELYY